jgi:hypothetical protein
MKRGHLPTIGTRFELPDVEATGLVVAHGTDVVLSYFYPFRMNECPDHELRPENAILVSWHNLRPYFTEGAIAEQRLVHGLNVLTWPHPTLLTSTEWGRGRCAANMMHDRHGRGTVPLTPAAARGITADEGFHQLANVAERLRRIIASGDVASGRTYILPEPRPNGGELLKRFLKDKPRSNP